MKETELSEPISLWLEKQGYTVSLEVKNCDIVARKNSELIIIELKTRFSLALVYQAVNRKNLTDSVYVAVPVLQGKKSIPKLKEVKKLLFRLEIGLILVRFLKTKTRVEIISHPGKYNPKKYAKKRNTIIREIDGRYSEFNKAGSTVKDQKVNAYKQQALVCAWLINKNGNMSPKDIRNSGGGVKTQVILSGNIYGWFDKVSRGIYTLNPAGKEALKIYQEIVKKIIANID